MIATPLLVAQLLVVAPGAANASPRDRRPWFWLGLAQLEQGRKAEARESLTRFLTLAPSRYDRQIGMGRDRLAQLR
jgi:cytochrome c-type biogenesis protein CcmH/NrfG